MWQPNSQHRCQSTTHSVWLTGDGQRHSPAAATVWKIKEKENTQTYIADYRFDFLDVYGNVFSFFSLSFFFLQDYLPWHLRLGVWLSMIAGTRSPSSCFWSAPLSISVCRTSSTTCCQTYWPGNLPHTHFLRAKNWFAQKKYNQGAKGKLMKRTLELDQYNSWY